MPELPEVETVRLGLEPSMSGKILSSVQTHRAGLRVPFPPALKLLKNRKIEKLTRRAKYLLVHFVPLNGQSDIMVIHLGMSGRITVIPDMTVYKRGKHDHMVLFLKGDAGIVFNDPRRFGLVLMVSESDIATHPAFSSIGPEPLTDDFTGKTFYQSLRNKKVPIKAALLDQKIVAGIGNIYACEALFEAKIAPQRLASDVSAPEAARLARAIKDVLGRAIEAGGSSLKDYRKTDGTLGYFQHGFKVYDREGEVCPRCKKGGKKADIIKRVVQSGRSTFYCASCQK